MVIKIADDTPIKKKVTKKKAKKKEVAKEEELVTMRTSCVGAIKEATPEWPVVEVEQKQRVITRKRRKKVAIVGCADSKGEAPFKDDEFEIWGVNNLYPLIEAHPDRYRWFEIHDISKDGEIYKRRDNPDFRGQPVNDYLKDLGKWASDINCPVYMQKSWDIVPTSIAYPLPQVLEKFGEYFTNSISWMLALAIHEGFEEIHVYGVDMAVDTEYHHQRPSCEYFLGIARGMGIKVFIPDTADLLKVRFLYGFDEPKETKWKKKRNSILKMMNTKKAKEEQISLISNNKIQQYIGAEQAIKEMDKIWG